MISVVIPAYNEADHIGGTIAWLKQHTPAALLHEIIVCDGGSSDATVDVAGAAGARVINSMVRRRSVQMNAGARVATAPVLYFLHADTLPPPDFAAAIKHAVDSGKAAGCFMLSFDHRHWFLKANCWFTRFDVDAFRFGDQSLFVDRHVFARSGGFCERHIVMEDQEIIRRLRRLTRFALIRKAVRTSARKYLENGIYKTQAIFFLIYFLYQLGWSQQALLRTYRRLMQQHKL